jgi:hypothetical protein
VYTVYYVPLIDLPVSAEEYVKPRQAARMRKEQTQPDPVTEWGHKYQSKKAPNNRGSWPSDSGAHSNLG